MRFVGVEGVVEFMKQLCPPCRMRFAIVKE